MNQPQTFPTKISGNQTCPDFISIARSKSPLPFESSGLRLHIWMASRSKVVGKPIGGEGVMMFHWHSHSFLIAPLLRSSLPTQETTDAIASNHNSAAFQPLSDCIEAAAEIHIVLYCSCRDILTNGPVGGIENPSPRRRREREMFEDLEQTPTTLPVYYPDHTTSIPHYTGWACAVRVWWHPPRNTKLGILLHASGSFL